MFCFLPDNANVWLRFSQESDQPSEQTLIIGPFWRGHGKCFSLAGASGESSRDTLIISDSPRLL